MIFTYLNCTPSAASRVYQVFAGLEKSQQCCSKRPSARWMLVKPIKIFHARVLPELQNTRVLMRSASNLG